MQIQSNIIYLPYIFDKEFPFYEWGDRLYSPPTVTGKLHRHNCLEIGYCFKGSGVFLANQDMLSFSTGDCSVVFPGTPHIAGSNPQDISYWHFVMIDMEAFCKMQKGAFPEWNLEKLEKNIPHIINAKDNSHLCMTIRMIVEQFEKRSNDYKSIVEGLTRALFFQIKELCTEGKAEPEAARYNAIVPALNHISNFYQERISVEMLADICSMSVSTFRRVFKEIVGKAPMDFVYETRIMVASNLLQKQQYAIYQIAEMVGYETLSSFNRHFKKYRKIAPKDWKKGVDKPDNSY